MTIHPDLENTLISFSTEAAQLKVQRLSSIFLRNLELCIKVYSQVSKAPFMLSFILVLNQMILTIIQFRLGDGERNYHIFYCMLAGLTKEHKQKLDLKDASSYKYLTGVNLKFVDKSFMLLFYIFQMLLTSELIMYSLYRVEALLVMAETIMQNLLTFDQR